MDSKVTKIIQCFSSTNPVSDCDAAIFYNEYENGTIKIYIHFGIDPDKPNDLALFTKKTFKTMEDADKFVNNFIIKHNFKKCVVSRADIDKNLTVILHK